LRALLVVLGVGFCGAAWAAPERGENLLASPGFETPGAWHKPGKGFTVVDEGRDGGKCILCESDVDNETSGAMQRLTFDPPIRHPFTVSGWSKAEGAAGADYCLYLDVWYEDGTNLWGMRGDFDGGTHDWQRVEYTVDVDKPVTKIEFFILFRRATGKAWFDDVRLSLTPFELRRERIVASLYGGNSIDYAAALSLPAQWKASILAGQGVVYVAEGEGAAVAMSWDGTDPAGARLAGGEYAIRVEATDRLRNEALVHRARVRTASGEGLGYVAWTASSMQRVLIDSIPPDAEPRASLREAAIALAGNEYESFQVAVRTAPGKTLDGCTVEVAALEGERGSIPAENVAWHQVGFVWLDALWPHPKRSHAAPGWWPDPLLPVRRFDVPPATTQSVWFTVYAPPGTPTGEYRGKVVIRPRNAPPIRVPVRATVYGFDLPVRSNLKTAFALMDGFLEKLYGKPLTPELRQAYGDFVLEHRLNPDDISRTDPPALEDLERYDGKGLNAFNVLNMVRPRGDAAWVCWSPLEVYRPEFKQSLIDRLDPYVAELEKRGLKDRAYVYTFDERGPEFFPVMTEYFGLIKQRYGIPTLTTAKVPQDAEVMRKLNVDWNCPVSSAYRFDEAEKCREAGLQVWTYVCLGPRYPFANFLADDPLIEARVIAWQAYHQKVDGFLYWGLNIWSRKNNDYLIDPEADGPRLRWSITTGGRWPALHGDGELLYAGKNGPIGSIRLANLRDGLEDYEYLHRLAESTGVDTARHACEPVTTSLTTFTREPEVVQAQRDRIARRIENAAP